MNWDRIEGNWKQVTGKAKEQWGKLTDDDLQVVAGRRDQLAVLLVGGDCWRWAGSCCRSTAPSCGPASSRTLFMPLHRWLLRRLRRVGATRRRCCTLLMAVVVVIVPLAAVSASLAREAMPASTAQAAVGESGTRLVLRRMFDALPTWVRSCWTQFGLPTSTPCSAG
jgi:hypothetical protein